MNHVPRQHHNATATIGGKEVNITIDLNAKKAVGPVHLASDARVHDGVVGARTEQDMHRASAAAEGESTFSNPAQNVHQLGFKEGMKVADFGSGSGAYTLALAKLVGSTGVVYAVDVQRELLTRTQNTAVQNGNENVEIIWGDIESDEGVAIKSDLLDGVLISNTLFQVDDKIATFKEAWRVLKPGGILAIIDWSESYGGLGPQQNAVVNQAEVTLIATDNGFAFKKEFTAGEHHYGLVFIKMVAGEAKADVVAASEEKEDDFISRTIAQELI